MPLMITPLARLAAANAELAKKGAEDRTSGKQTAWTLLTAAKQRESELEQRLSATTFGKRVQSKRPANKAIHEFVSANACT